MTTVLVAAALLLRLSWEQALQGHTFLLFYPVILLSVILFGQRQGIYAALLSAGLAYWYLIEPRSTFWVEQEGDLFGILLFLIVGITTAYLVGALRQTSVRLEDMRKELEVFGRERELLLRELSHRILNDLATLSSLLLMHARSSEDAASKAVLQSAANSVQVMGRVYQRLRMRENRAVVEASSFIEELCSDLKTSLAIHRNVDLKASAEQHTLALHRAIAVGLIINELVTNALKYAFADRNSGRVEVTLKRCNGELLLVVADDGVGIDPSRKMAGLGHQLVRSFAALLGGTVEISPARPGTRVSIRFPAESSPT